MTTTFTDEQLAQENWIIANLELYTEEALKRVLWMGVSGRIYLPQAAGDSIDEEIRMREARANGYGMGWDDDEDYL